MVAAGPSPYLRAKHLWFRGQLREAVDQLTEVLGERAVYVADDALARYAAMPFEPFVTILLADHLTVPFRTAAARLWEAYPGFVAVTAANLHGGAFGDWLYAAAADGLVSTDPADHDRIAKVTLVPVPDAVDRFRLDAAIASADATGAWIRWVDAHPDVTASLFLDAVFFRARVMHPEMVLDRLDLIAELQPEVFDRVAGALARWDPAEVARIGMRLEVGADSGAECAKRLLEALRRRDAEALPDTCLR